MIERGSKTPYLPAGSRHLHRTYLAFGSSNGLTNHSEKRDCKTPVPYKQQSGDCKDYKGQGAYNNPLKSHKLHLENFFNAVRGKGKLNCPADEAFRSEVAVYKVNEAVASGQKIVFTEEDFKI